MENASLFLESGPGNSKRIVDTELSQRGTQAVPPQGGGGGGWWGGSTGDADNSQARGHAPAAPTCSTRTVGFGRIVGLHCCGHLTSLK
jgi:hypothetical protein